MSTKRPSKLILDLGKEIEEKSGAKLNIVQGTTAPVQEWIPEAKMSKTNAIHLRTAAQTRQNESVIKLQQFNPSFFLPEPYEIPCRVPGCSVTTPRIKPTFSSENVKQDLFLCETHLTKMTNIVTKRIEEEQIDFSIANFKHEDFSGYTYLIGALEKAYMHLMKKPATRFIPQSVYPNSDLTLAEVFLNTRNFLTITNALLNPNGDNVEVVLSPYYTIFNEILSSLRDPQLLPRLVRALRDVMDIPLQCFGIMYEWVFLGNPGAQVGGGVGIVLGVVLGAASFAFIPAGIVATGVAGLIAGNLIGGGGYAWYQQRHEVERQNQRVREYQQFLRQQFGQAAPRMPLPYIQGNSTGDLTYYVGQGTPAL